MGTIEVNGGAVRPVPPGTPNVDVDFLLTRVPSWQRETAEFLCQVGNLSKGM